MGFGHADYRERRRILFAITSLIALIACSRASLKESKHHSSDISRRLSGGLDVWILKWRVFANAMVFRSNDSSGVAPASFALGLRKWQGTSSDRDRRSLKELQFDFDHWEARSIQFRSGRVVFSSTAITKSTGSAHRVSGQSRIDGRKTHLLLDRNQLGVLAKSDLGSAEPDILHR